MFGKYSELDGISVTELEKYMVRDKATRRDEAKKSILGDHAKNQAMRSVN